MDDLTGDGPASDADPDDHLGAGIEGDLDEEYRLTRREQEANTSARLEAYTERTRTPLDLFAMLTLWIVLVPLSDFARGRIAIGALIVRASISVVFGIDMAIRARLAPHSWRYVREHPLGLFAVVLPPIRVLFSLRLINSVFRRGNLGRFLVAAGVLLLNGAIIVFLVERHAPGANIVTLGDSVWWSVVTVTTVGYGDLYPVTTYGRVVAAFLMVTGLVTLAVITANVAASFNEQAQRRRSASSAALSTESLRALRDQIDRLLAEQDPEPAAGAIGDASGGRSSRTDDGAAT